MVLAVSLDGSVLRAQEDALPRPDAGIREALDPEGLRTPDSEAYPAPGSRGFQLGGESIYGDDRLVEREDGMFHLPELRAPTIDLSVIGVRALPRALEDPSSENVIPLPEGPDRPGNWSYSAYLWQAPNTFSNPLYFEDVMLERHGHERCPPLQPLVSGARFFATVPMLPYLATVQHPCDCYYTLGYYRPGSCAPALCQRPPYQRNAALVEGAAIAGGILILP